MSTYTETQLIERTHQIVNATAAKHGVDPETFTTAHRADARNAAREQLEYENDPHVQALQASQEENRHLKAQLDALRSRGPVSVPSGRAPLNAAQVRGRLGNTFYTLSNAQKITAAGIDPSTVNVAELKKLFARGCDTKAALDYSRQAPSDYAKKRELAKLLDLYGG
jgi:hypothetical protein